MAYLLAGDCNPLQVMQLFASIQEELALANKKFANDQLQDAIKITEEIRKMQLQAADKERSTSIFKAITSLTISGSGVIGGQLWTVTSNALKTADISKALKAARDRGDKADSEKFREEKTKNSTSRFGGAIQQMSASMAAPIGEAVTADATRALRQQNSAIERIKSILDQI